MARFKNEAKAAGRLHHPNIVGVYEYGEDDAVTFIAMEYVEGAGPARVSEPPGEFRFRAARRAHGPAPERARVRARPRRRPPGHQAVEPDRHEPWRAESRRFRHRARRPHRSHDGRHADRHADVHVARAMPGPRRRFPLRSLQRRRRALRAPDRREAVPRQHGGDHLQDLPRGPGAAVAAVQAPAPAAVDQLVATALAKDPAARFQNAHAFRDALRDVAQCRWRSRTQPGRRWWPSAR